jgi:hypothetical protein
MPGGLDRDLIFFVRVRDLQHCFQIKMNDFADIRRPPRKLRWIALNSATLRPLAAATLRRLTAATLRPLIAASGRALITPSLRPLMAAGCRTLGHPRNAAGCRRRTAVNALCGGGALRFIPLAE